MTKCNNVTSCVCVCASIRCVRKTPQRQMQIIKIICILFESESAGGGNSKTILLLLL